MAGATPRLGGLGLDGEGRYLFGQPQSETKEEKS